MLLTAVVDEEVNYLQPHEDVVRQAGDGAVAYFEVTNLSKYLVLQYCSNGIVLLNFIQPLKTDTY